MSSLQGSDSLHVHELLFFLAGPVYNGTPGPGPTSGGGRYFEATSTHGALLDEALEALHSAAGPAALASRAPADFVQAPFLRRALLTRCTPGGFWHLLPRGNILHPQCSITALLHGRADLTRRPPRATHPARVQCMQCRLPAAPLLSHHVGAHVV